MTQYTRALRFKLPLMRGEDVLALQQRLRELGLFGVGQPDGLFGTKTEGAVKEFQKNNNLKVDGIVGPRTWTELFKTSERNTGLDKTQSVLEELKASHQYRNVSVSWRLDKKGILIDGSDKLETFGGEPATVRKIWQNFGMFVDEWSKGLGVPAELIVATIATETRGDPKAVREEPGYKSDEETPHKVSPGLMQTLISTARAALGDDTINRGWLLEPNNSIRAGTAYIAQQWRVTHFDPPKVACAYNAGSIFFNNSPDNRWKMRQFPINSSEHADRFVKWFNECFIMFEKDGVKPDVSFFALL